MVPETGFADLWLSIIYLSSVSNLDREKGKNCCASRPGRKAVVVGNNTFLGGVEDTEARFELLPDGKAKVQFRFIRRRKLELEGTKILSYKELK